MNQQDKSFMITFTTVLSVLVLISVAIFLAARMVSMVSVQPQDNTRKIATAEERIKPVAKVVVAAASAPPAAQGATAAPSMTAPTGAASNAGEATFNTACAACHKAGVLGAPKVGSKADWEPRFAQGLDTLVSHAVNGIRAMPPKGGNAALSEQEIKDSVVYMLQESSIEVEGAAPAVAAAQPAAAAPAAPAPAPAPAAPAATVAAKAPAAPSVPAAAQEDALMAAQKAAMAARDAASAAQEAAAVAKEAIGIAREAVAAVREAVAAAQQAAAAAKAAVKEGGPSKHPTPPPAEGSKPAPESEAPPAKEATPAPKASDSEGGTPEKEPASPAGESSATTAVEKPPATVPQQAASIRLPADVDLARGKQLYQTACIICHKTGAGGAPKLDDKAVWAPRLAQGFDALVAHSLRSYKGMLAMDIPDQDFISAVGYMVTVVQ